MINFSQSLQERYRFVQDQIFKACDRSNRSPADVILLGASKGQSFDLIKSFLDFGLKYIGENYLQEAVDKISLINSYKPTVQKHFIGHLQTNKVKKVIQLFNSIQSVDSLKLAKEIDKRFPQVFPDNENPQPYSVFVEVNLSGDENKSGCSPSDAFELVEFITDQTKYVQCVGLMTISPLQMIKESDLHRFFTDMSKLSEQIQSSFPDCTQLSMGMSDDFEIAIEEGSTLVRLGTLLFGPRK